MERQNFIEAKQEECEGESEDFSSRGRQMLTVDTTYVEAGGVQIPRMSVSCHNVL